MENDNESIDDDTDNESIDDDTLDDWFDQFSINDCIDIEQSIYEILDELIHVNISAMSNTKFDNMIVDATIEILAESIDNNIDDNNIDDNIIMDRLSYVYDAIDLPQRSESTCLTKPPSDISAKIAKLRAAYQPEQRTKEWYQYRYNLITASNIYKLFSSESQYNSLVYEKCKPLDESSSSSAHFVNVSSPMHWGVKYEPVTVAIYSQKYSVVVGEFGCIKHETIPCIGASPDGIVTMDSICGPENRLGRMVEIKNIFNRDIDGIPSEAYWVQTQVQMETCDLDECDFVETRFKEYAGPDEFFDDFGAQERGVILYFVKKNMTAVSNAPHYEYMPLTIELTVEAVEQWIKEKRESIRSEYALYTTIYWYLDEFSCVLVRRNRLWFESVVPKIKAAWQTIEEERVSGYEHRAPKSRKPTGVEHARDINHYFKNMPVMANICLIKLE